MNLAVRVGVERTFMFEVRDVHCNHGSLLFFNIEIFTKASFESVIKVQGIWTTTLQTFYMVFLEQDQTVLNNKQGSLHSARICEKAHLLIRNVSHDRYFFGYFRSSSKILDTVDKVVWVRMHTKPSTVDEDLNVLAISNLLLVNYTQLLYTEVLED